MQQDKLNTKPTFSSLVIGATGLVGNYCLQNLLEDPRYNKITVLVRRSIPYHHPKLKTQIIDFNRLSDFSAAIEADHIFCCLGTTIKTAGSQQAFRQVDFNLPYDIAQISLKNGAQQFLLVSAFTASSYSKIFYNRVKGELEEALKRLGYRGLLIFRPFIILGNRREKHPGERVTQIISRIIHPVLVGKFRRYKPIHARTIAKTIVEMAKIQLTGIHFFDADQMQFFYNQLSKKDASVL